MSKKIFIFLFQIFLLTSLFAQKAQTPEEYFVQYTKMLTLSQNNLVMLNKKGDLPRIGKETRNGNISGVVHYDMRLVGFGGVVTMLYENYSDDPGWTFDGTIVINANMSRNGTLCGTVTVTGDNPGKVIYDNVILKNENPGDGYYIVEDPSGKQSSVDYHYYFEGAKDKKKPD